MISSRANATVKSTVRLRKRLERVKRGVFLVEGHRAIAVAVARGVRLLEIFHTAAAAANREVLLRSITGAKIHAVTPAIMAHLTDHDHPPDILAVAPMRPSSLRQASTGDVVVVLAGVHDPAVAGGILAAAAGTGATGAIALRGTTDVFAPGCVRAAAGAHFALHLTVDVEPADAAAALEGRRVAALSDEGSPVCSDAMRAPIALITGETSVREFPAAERVCIPAAAGGVRPGPVASAAIALYLARQP